jgi:hypothetical protein
MRCPISCITVANMAETPVFAMRLPVSVHRALREAAKADMRPVSQMAVQILRDHLVREGFLSEEQRHRKQVRGRAK